ncbi:uncharacterized protein LOC144099177 [Amblyomma americanum]
MEIIVAFVTALALSSAAVSAEDKSAGKKTKIEGRGFPLSSIGAIGSCPPCPCNYGSGVAGGVRPVAGNGAGLSSGAGVVPGGAAVLSGAGLHDTGAGGEGLTHGAHGAGFALKSGHGAPVVAGGASIRPVVAGALPGSLRGPGLVSGGGTSVFGAPVVTGPGIEAGAGYAEGASGHSNFEAGSGFVRSGGASAGVKHLASAGLSGVGIHASGSGGVGPGIGAHGVGSVLKAGHGGAIVTPGAGVHPAVGGAVLPGAAQGSGLVSSGGVSVIETPLVTGSGIGAGLGAGHAAGASGQSSFEKGSGFANKAGGNKAGQGSFAYNVGGSDSSSYGHSSSYGDSKSFGVSASDGFNHANGQGSHGSEFKKEAAGSAASSHSSGTKTKVVV